MSSEFHLRRQMSCTRGELMSWLPGATRGALIEIVGNALEQRLLGSTQRFDFDFILTPPCMRKLFANVRDVALIRAHSTQPRA